MDIFKNLPEKLLEHSNSGKLIVLDNPDVIYILKSGELNLFLTKFDAQGRAGSRTFYSSLSELNSIVIRGISSPQGAVKLCAVPHLDSIYLEMPLSELDQLPISERKFIEEQLSTLAAGLIKTADRNFEVAPAKLPTVFTQNSDELTTLLESFVLAKEREFKKQYQQLKDEDVKSHNRAFANLFRFFTKSEKPTFTKNNNTLIGAINALGQIQELDFQVSDMQLDAPENSQLDVISKQSLLRKRTITLEPDWHLKTGLPFLGKLKNGENIAVFNHEENESTWYYYNSAVGEVVEVNDDEAENILKKGIVFYKPLPNEPLTFKSLLLIMWKMVKLDFKKALWLFFIASLLSSTIPIINALIFTTVIPMADHRLLMQIFILAIGFALTKGIIEYLNLILLLRIRTRIAWALQAGIWDRILSLPVSFFKDYSIGDITNRSLGVAQLVDIFGNTFLKNILTWVFSFPALILMFYYSPLFSVVMIAFIILMVLCFVICASLSYKLQKKIAAISGEIQGNIVQYFAGINKIRASKTENQTLEHWSEGFAQKKELYYKLANINKVTSVLSSALPIFTITVMIALAVLVFTVAPEKAIAVPDFIAFSASLSIVSASFGLMLTSLAEGIGAISIYQRLKPILKTPGETAFGQSQAGEISGALSIKHVTFKYNASERPILNGINLSISPGEFVAIVGESGSGKSTLLRLLLGFERPQQGSISYDDVDISQVDLRSLRSQIGVVLQDGKLLPESIFKNIVSGSSSLTIDDAWEAAEKAGCAADIKAMPMQMHTILSGDGGGISGGQRQRVLIARALARKPKILFFDEATSALDNKAQSIVSETIGALTITKIIIAHRLSTVIKADRIIVLAKGKIVEEGTYGELMALGGHFAKQAKRQILGSAD